MTPFSAKKFVLSSLVALLMGACSSTPTPPPPLTLNITADPQANNGALFYFVVRNANEKQFMLEGYQSVAAKTFSDPPDPNTVGVFSIIPGTEQAYEVSLPAQGALALYFLFTQPGSQWKKLLSVPMADEYDINLKPDNNVGISEHKPWYSWF